MAALTTSTARVCPVAAVAAALNSFMTATANKSLGAVHMPSTTLNSTVYPSVEYLIRMVPKRVLHSALPFLDFPAASPSQGLLFVVAVQEVHIDARVTFRRPRRQRHQHYTRHLFAVPTVTSNKSVAADNFTPTSTPMPVVTMPGHPASQLLPSGKTPTASGPSPTLGPSQILLFAIFETDGRHTKQTRPV
ncbi:predicted protein [Pyrenophora tritici-repentis Pt-1C-BFP]|uniref:Uncharacterized protein n=1 Tax=Pyrenophora tritici-repentis (strain Pt-1C-BFP) TaxID=426418 RepID=B2W607_PYRTR|nr:uncharacterized protein PTRG_06165 [Pyrenophora tritici-repentis Pt-1C-BFP]EDU49085.1 predicted protein [Pyrenophora tritici-repentis Pt-1C-BFP]